jgi:hypothetical protein
MNEPKANRTYCREHIDSLDSYDAFKKSFAEIIDKDSPGKSKKFGFSNNVLSMVCIDMDAMEASQSGLHNQTMDCVCPIARYDRKRRTFSAKKLLLVEVKLNCTTHRLGESDYTGKISHTRSLLVGEMLHETNVFLFTKAVKGIAKSNVERWKRGSHGNRFKHVSIMTPDDFSNYIDF